MSFGTEGASQAPDTSQSAPASAPSSAPSSSPASQSTPGASTSTPSSFQVGENGSMTPDSDGNGAPPAYTPNFKFKVHDQEHEIPEFIRSAIKDAATEKQAKEIFEKAFGLDVVKPKLEKTRLDLQTERTQHKQLNSQVQTLGKYIQTNDFDSFFEALKVPKDTIFGWVHSKLQERELPPHVQQELQHKREMQREYYALEAQNRELSEGAMSHSEQAKLTDLRTAISSPDVKSVADAFDKRLGKPGAFVREVVKRAALAEQLEQRDLSAEEAVAEVLAVLGPLGAPQQENAPVIPASQSTQGALQGQGLKSPPPVIPHVGGKQNSPTKKLARSIEDLKRMAAEM